MNADFNTIVEAILFSVGIFGLFVLSVNCLFQYLKQKDEAEQYRRQLEAEEKCREYEYKRAKEEEERRRKKEEWENIRPRWEEHIKWFNRLHEEQRSHLQVSFKRNKTNETMDD